MLADLPRKNCWTIAEHAGDVGPDGMQHLLGRAVWDTDGVRDDLRAWVVEHLGDPAAVLVVDETGDVKKGNSTVGAQRQYTGTAGQVENAQVAVYLTYAGARGHAMIYRELYLPKSWTTDPQRCAAAGVPDEVEFATKPALARSMIGRALDAGVPARWAAADEVYGADPGLRADPEARQVGYVLAIGCDRRVPTAAGPMRADTLAAGPKGSWQRLSAGPGAKGQRYYDWAWVTLTAESGHHWLLVRRHIRHGELAFYRCYSPTPVALGELVRVAGRRWTIEENFQAGKGLAGLDEHQVRRWLSWRRWTLLAMLAHALLAVIAATERAQHPPQPGLNRLDLQRDPTPVHQTDHRTHPPAHRSAGLVTMATSPSTPCPRQPLPPPTSSTHVITIYGWSTSGHGLSTSAVVATVDVSCTAMEGGDMADERQDIARRLRELRAWRRKSLKVIAELAGITEGHLSRLERGQRRLDKRSTIAALAAALEVSPSELIGQPVRWDDPAMAEAQATIPALRLALVGTQLGQLGTGSARPVGDVVIEVDSCVALRTACDFAAMGAILPSLLADLYATIALVRDEERTVALRQLIRALNSAMTMAHAFGYADLACLITERSAQAADDLRDPAWSAIAAFSRVHALLPMGGHNHAYTLATRATDAARSVTGEVSGNPALASYGALCMVSALTAAVTGRADESDTRLAEAAAIAQRTGETGPDVAYFGPTNVAMYRMTSALERGDSNLAVELAGSVQPTHIASPERRAKHWLDTGRALTALRGREYDAVAAFQHSETLAALRLRSNIYAREAVTGLLPRVRRDTAAGRELRGIAYRMGLNA